MIPIRLLYLLVFGLLVCHVRAQTGPQVTLPDPSGVTLTGVYMPMQESVFLNVDKNIEAYLGIPYAEPPVGDLRFKNPVATLLRRNYAATRDRPQCSQLSPIDHVPVVGRNLDEDCLYLGVYTPSPPPTNAGVMVWFHGGAFVVGSGSSVIYEPLPMVALSDIIVVTVNYRLGVYGFLTTGDSVAPGNYGMRDQVMALEWVQHNIAAFGGDPSRVTIAGESAGAASVGIQLLSPLSAGLFSQVIMQSGNALCPWAVDTNMKRQVALTSEIATHVNCSNQDNTALIECLRQVDEKHLTRAQSIISAQHLTSELIYVPVVDGQFLPDTPLELVKSQQFHNVPALMGTNRDEGTMMAAKVYPSYTIRKNPPKMDLNEFRKILPSYLFYNSPMELAAVEQWYLDWTIADDASADQLDAFVQINTDQMFACGTEAMVRALYDVGAPVYRYQMTHVPAWSIIVGLPEWLGAGHAEDLQYVFAWGLIPTISNIVGQTDDEKKMSVQFLRYWSNFVTSGDPNAPLTTNEYPDWPRYSIPEEEYKDLSLSMTNGRAMRMNECAFWLNYLPTIHTLDAGNNDELHQDRPEQHIN